MKSKERDQKSRRVVSNARKAHLVFFECSSRTKDSEMFNCLNCFKPFKSKRWTMQRSPLPGYACLAARCPDCKTKSFKHVPRER